MVKYDMVFYWICCGVVIKFICKKKCCYKFYFCKILMFVVKLYLLYVLLKIEIFFVICKWMFDYECYIKLL